MVPVARFMLEPLLMKPLPEAAAYWAVISCVPTASVLILMLAVAVLPVPLVRVWVVPI